MSSDSSPPCPHCGSRDRPKNDHGLCQDWKTCHQEFKVQEKILGRLVSHPGELDRTDRRP